MCIRDRFFVILTVSSNSELESPFKQELRPSDTSSTLGLSEIKPPVSVAAAYSLYNDNPNSRSIDYISSPYYSANSIPKPTLRPTKILQQENSSKAVEEEKLLVKNECSRTSIKNEQLIKSEMNDCRTMAGSQSSTMMSASYDSYLNNDSNSSSVSSMDTLNQQTSHQYPLSAELQISSAGLQVQPNVHNTTSSVYMLDEKRLLQQHHVNSSTYDSSSMIYNNASDDLYQQHHDRTFALGNINRPVPSYSNEMTCGYDVRSYDSSTPYERYEASAQSCERYSAQYAEQNLLNFNHQQSHLQAAIKSDQCQHHEQQQQTTTPAYPR